MRLDESDTLKSAGLQRDALLRMRGRLLGGTSRAPPKSLVHGTVRCATWVGAGLDETIASGA